MAIENDRAGGQRRKKTMYVDCDKKSPAWRPKKEKTVDDQAMESSQAEAARAKIRRALAQGVSDHRLLKSELTLAFRMISQMLQ